MRIPMQSKPVRSQLSSNANGVNISGLECTLCKAACSNLNGIAKLLCDAACDKTVC